MRVVIAGAGSVGRSIARELLHNGHEILLIDKEADQVRVQRLPEANWLAGDACEISRLQEARLDDCDVVVAASAHTNNGCTSLPVPGASLSMTASFDMLRAAVDASRASGATTHVGSVFSTDFFYTTRPEVTEGLIKVGTLGVEMEAAGLYGCAMTEGKEALAVLTVSDHLTKDGTDMSAAQRETSFSSALEIAAAALTA